MGLKFKLQPSSRKILDKVNCDKCGKSIKKIGNAGWNPFGKPHTIFHDSWFDEHVVIEHTWGYGSYKDGCFYRIVLCEPCFDLIFKKIGKEIEK